MSQPMILCYNLSKEKLAAATLAAMRLRIKVRVVKEEEFGCTLGFLAEGGKEETSRPAPFSDEMLVMAWFTRPQMDAFLNALRAMKDSRISLKAILTPTNSDWDGPTLCQELKKEREAVLAGRGDAHQ